MINITECVILAPQQKLPKWPTANNQKLQLGILELGKLSVYKIPCSFVFVKLKVPYYELHVL